ncbi:hypothetical protein LJB42_001084 [Komagataella kurtzmanii]|nr:hypothetical protein LJB42_001084 [Komagataella kurtzmanii]
MDGNISLGLVIYSAVKPIIKLYLALGLGFLLSRVNLLSVETSRGISDLVLMIFLPFLVFDKIVTNLSIADLKTIGIIFLSAFFMYGVGATASSLIALVFKPPKRFKYGFIVGGILPNVSDLPIAYLSNGISFFTDQQSQKGIAYICIYLATYILVQFNFGLFQVVEWDFREKKEDKETQLVDLSKVLSHKLQPQETTPTVSSIDSNIDEQDLQPIPIAPDNLVSVSSETSHVDLQSLGRIPSARLREPEQHSTRNSVSSITSHRLLSRIISNQDEENQIVKEYSKAEPFNAHIDPLMKIVTETNLSATDINVSGNKIKFVQKYKLQWLVFFYQNLKKPCSVALVSSLIIALIPWVKALFVETTKNIPSAPDNKPPLSFLMDFTSFIGQAAVPMGILLLGATLGRLKVSSFPPGYWKCVVSLTVFKLCIMPIIGTVFSNRLAKIGWISDEVVHFIVILQWSLPSATVQLFLTASNTRLEDGPNGKATGHVQLDCLSIYLLGQYMILFITLPFVVAYTVKCTL